MNAWMCAACCLLLCLVAGAQQAPQGLPPDVFAEIIGAGPLPDGTYAASQSWEAESAGHRIGREVADDRASGKKAWEALEGQDENGTLIYGPYLELPAGDYLALMRLSLSAGSDGETDDAVATLDACVDYGRTVLASREVLAVDVKPDTYVRVPLAFRYRGGKLECRVHWTGFGRLRVDNISLFSVTGAGDLSRLGRVPQPRASGEPSDIDAASEPRPFPEVFPRCPVPASQLVVADVRRLPPDEQMALLTLQGLVNRSLPRVFLISSAEDEVWLAHMQERGWIAGTERIADARTLLERFRSAARGVIITDPRLPATKNVATTLAGVRDAVVASPRVATRLGWPTVEDLRGRWKTSVEAYRWCFENLWPQLNHHVIACSWPDHLPLRDYLVAQRVFIFWLAGPLDGAHPYADPDGEVRLMEELLAKMPPNIPVMSYPWAGKDVGIGEGPGVSLFAEFGKYLVGTIGVGNLTIHSGIRVPQLRQPPAPPCPKYDPSKVYVSWIMSDGDNLPVLTNHNFPQLWRQPDRGKIPMGWSVSPAALNLIPDVVDWYYAHATPDDYFLGAVSGVGYTYPDLYGKRYREPIRKEVYDGFLDQTRDTMSLLDLRQLWIMNATRPEVIARYAQRIPQLEALFPDYGRRLSSAAEATYPTARNVPVFHAVTTWREDEPQAEKCPRVVEEIRRFTPKARPAFLHLFALNWFVDLPLLQQIAEGLGPEYVLVRPDHLAELYRQYLEAQQVLIAAPESVAALEGRRFAASITVHNATGRPMTDLRVSVSGGLGEVAVAPATLLLQPAETATVRISGVPGTEPFRVQITGAFGIRSVSCTVHLVRRSEVLGALPDTGDLESAGLLEAETLSHLWGKMADDPDASGGKVWEALKPDAQNGHVLYGPYTTFAAGRYLAMFRVRRSGPGDGPLLDLDTCVGGGTPQTGLVKMNAEELPQGKWRWVPILFDHPGGALETRALWRGAADVQLDCVGLWRIAGADNAP
jgi:hypothetical protein